MQVLNDADYYALVTDESNYQRGIEIVGRVHKKLSTDDEVKELIVPYLTQEVHTEIMALLGYLRTVEDIRKIELDPSCASIFARHSLFRNMLPLFWARVDLEEGQLKSEYSKVLDGIDHLTNLVPDKLP